jgi:hypothetical protein
MANAEVVAVAQIELFDLFDLVILRCNQSLVHQLGGGRVEFPRKAAENVTTDKQE